MGRFPDPYRYYQMKLREDSKIKTPLLNLYFKNVFMRPSIKFFMDKSRKLLNR